MLRDVSRFDGKDSIVTALMALERQGYGTFRSVSPDTCASDL